MNRKLLVSAVATAVAGLAPAVQAQIPNEFMLFPYVVKDANRTTVVTLMGLGNPLSVGPSLHLQYWTKSTTDANTAACQTSSVTLPFTPYDIVTFDTAGILGYPLFGDTTNPAPVGTSISYAAPRHGYLLAQGTTAYFQAGYWLELDLANGGAHGDRAIVGSLFPDYSLQEAFNGYGFALWAADGSVTNFSSLLAGVQFWPSSVATTAFTVTPMGSDMLTRENNQVILQVRNMDNVQGAYDRNENGVDGTVPVTVRCVGRVTPAQLMPGVVSNVAWAAQGGWGILVNLGNGDTVFDNLGGIQFSTYTTSDDRPAVVYQVDNSTASGKFMTNATRISTLDGASETEF